MAYAAHSPANAPTSLGSGLTNRRGFTLIELLVVISIIAMLISILMPSLGRARDQAKGVHCVARLHDMANALTVYSNNYDDHLPVAEYYPAPDLYPTQRFGWCELLWSSIYLEPAYVYEDSESCPEIFPVQRNVDPKRYAKYFVCKAGKLSGTMSGHYRAYLPWWSGVGYGRDDQGRMTGTGNPYVSARTSSISPKGILIGDANETSHRGDGDPAPPWPTCGDGDDCSYVDGGEADTAGTTGEDGNRFSDRHYGGTNYLWADMHAEWQPRLRDQLALDWNLDGIQEVEVGQ